MTRLVYLVDYPMAACDYERFGVRQMRDAGLDVEIWDFSRFIYAKSEPWKRIPDPVDPSLVRVFPTQREAVAAIESLPDSTWLLLILAWTWRHWPVYRAITRRRLPFGFESTIVLPKNPVPRQNRIHVLLQQPDLVPQVIYRRIPRRFLGIAPATFVMAGGELSVPAGHPLVGPETEIVRCHTLDYDRFLELRGGERIHPARYAVFLDQYWPLHPEFQMEGVRNPVEPETYYPRLCRLFRKIETELGLEVVIAAHPRADYESHPDYFEGRRILRGRTIELVRDAELVVAHNTTALNFDNLFRKPVVFLKLDLPPEFYRLVDVFTDAISSAFGKVPVHMDDIDAIDWSREMKVDAAAYDEYRRRYIKSDGTPDVHSWRQVADYIRARSPFDRAAGEPVPSPGYAGGPAR